MPTVDGLISNEKVITSVHEATEKDVDIAVAAARKAFEGEWRQVTPEDRGRMLLKLADLVEQNLDLLAAVESLDNGKALILAKGDMANSAKTFRYYGGWADKLTGQTIDTQPDMFNYTRQEPVSVARVLTSSTASKTCFGSPNPTLTLSRLASALRSSPGTSRP